MGPSVAALFKALHQAGKSASKPTLQVGQFISGKIVELLPKNQAVVQLNGQNIKAQLDTPLTKGERYMLQVTSTNDLPYLKMVSQKPMASSKTIVDLLKQAGLKASSGNIKMLQHLTKTGVPLTQGTISDAFKILNKEGHTRQSRDIIMKIFEKQLPVKPSVFQALLTRETTSLSTVLAEGMNDPEGEDTKSPRITELMKIVNGKQTSPSMKHALSNQLLQETLVNRQTTFKLLKKAEVLPKALAFETFQQEVRRWSGQRVETVPTELEASRIVIKNENNRIPFPNLPSEKELPVSMRNLFKDQLPFSNKEIPMVREWVNQVERLAQPTSSSSTAAQMNKLVNTHQNMRQAQAFTKLEPYVSQDMQYIAKQVEQYIASSTTKPTIPMELVNKLQSLLQRQVPESGQPQVIEWAVRSQSSSTQEIGKDSFLLKIKSMIHLSGIHDEPLLLRDLEHNSSNQRETTVKSLIVQSLQEGGGTKTEFLKQALNLLNGVQLTSQQDSGPMTQLSLQIPAELLKMKEDAYVNIEGKKNKNGEINPDYCHIMFYLDLTNMEETVIDLMIVDRRVSVTIYNENEIEKTMSRNYKEKLQTGLESLGYNLATIKVKTTGMEKPSPIARQTEQSGVDLRI
ncbi:hypothetical protein [Halobacillus seohaensis]|uniref:Flagellar hook-length control protein-like C-terminal domain-containing protein n=1 Tax=Halobacillus seohaensis TaxID=447421 RepID=A0ABW2EG46_9BACI